MKASIIIPVFEQVERLRLTLSTLARQTVGPNEFEVIVVDDGSENPVAEALSDLALPYRLVYVRQPNRGRAVARNTGVRRSQHELLIFCDADRVPGKEFVAAHLDRHRERDDSVVVGLVREVYLSNLQKAAAQFAEDPDSMAKRSKMPAYPRMIERLFDEQGHTDSSIPWVSTFSGNMSLARRSFERAGGFSESFRDWGLEHFEVGYRLVKTGSPFLMERRAVNYHIAHTRDVSKLAHYIDASIRQMVALHPGDPAIPAFGRFMRGELSLQDVEPNRRASWLQRATDPLTFAVGLL